MSRVEKVGGIKFKPVARPKPKAPAATSSQPVPATPTISQSTTQAPTSSAAVPPSSIVAAAQHDEQSSVLAPPPSGGRLAIPIGPGSNMRPSGISLTERGPSQDAPSLSLLPAQPRRPSGMAPPSSLVPPASAPPPPVRPPAPIGISASPAPDSSRRASTSQPIAIGASGMARRPSHAVDLRPTMPNPYLDRAPPAPIVPSSSSSSFGPVPLSQPTGGRGRPMSLAPPSGSSGRPTESADIGSHTSLEAVAAARQAARSQMSGSSVLPSVFEDEPPAAATVIDGRTKEGRARRKKALEDGEVVEDASKKRVRKKKAGPDEGTSSTPEGEAPTTKLPKKSRKRKSTQTEGSPDPEAELMAEEAASADSTSASASASEKLPRKRSKRSTPLRLVRNDDVDVESVIPGQALGPPIDPSQMTMAEIAAKPGQGRISSRAVYLQKMQAEKKKKKEALQQAKDAENAEVEVEVEVVEANPSSQRGNVFSRIMSSYNDAAAQAKETVDAEVVEDDDGLGGGFVSQQGGPQVRLVNGQLVLDEETLIIDEHKQHQDALFSGTVEYEELDERDKFVNSASYQRKPRGSKWTLEDDALFFDKISEFGSDFGLLACFFPGRTRSHVRNRYNKASREEPQRLWDAENRRTPINVESLSKAAGVDFSEPLPAESLAVLEGRTMEPGDRDVSPTPTTGSRSERAASEDRRNPQSNRRRSRAQLRKQQDEGLEVVGDIDTYERPRAPEPY